MKNFTPLVLAALAACTTVPPATVSPTPPPSSVMAVAPAGLGTGVYAVTLADADLPSSLSADMRGQMVGSWEMTVDGPGHAVVRYNGQQVVDAPFTVQGNQITFADDSGQYACHAPARYTWEMAGGGLRFTKIEDPCDGRVAALTTHPWIKRP